MKGQLSAEMLVVLVLVLGLAIVLASVMFKSAGKAADKIEEKTESALSDRGSGAALGDAGDYCLTGTDCKSDSCDTYSKTCN